MSQNQYSKTNEKKEANQTSSPISFSSLSTVTSAELNQKANPIRQLSDQQFFYNSLVSLHPNTIEQPKQNEKYSPPLLASTSHSPCIYRRQRSRTVQPTIPNKSLEYNLNNSHHINSNLSSPHLHEHHTRSKSTTILPSLDSFESSSSSRRRKNVSIREKTTILIRLLEGQQQNQKEFAESSSKNSRSQFPSEGAQQKILRFHKNRRIIQRNYQDSSFNFTAKLACQNHQLTTQIPRPQQFIDPSIVISLAITENQPDFSQILITSYETLLTDDYLLEQAILLYFVYEAVDYDKQLNILKFLIAWTTNNHSSPFSEFSVLFQDLLAAFIEFLQLISQQIPSTIITSSNKSLNNQAIKPFPESCCHCKQLLQLSHEASSGFDCTHIFLSPSTSMKRRAPPPALHSHQMSQSEILTSQKRKLLSSIVLTPLKAKSVDLPGVVESLNLIKHSDHQYLSKLSIEKTASLLEISEAKTATTQIHGSEFRPTPQTKHDLNIFNSIESSRNPHDELFESHPLHNHLNHPSSNKDNNMNQIQRASTSTTDFQCKVNQFPSIFTSNIRLSLEHPRNNSTTLMSNNNNNNKNNNSNSNSRRAISFLGLKRSLKKVDPSSMVEEIIEEDFDRRESIQEILEPRQQSFIEQYSKLAQSHLTSNSSLHSDRVSFVSKQRSKQKLSRATLIYPRSGPLNKRKILGEKANQIQILKPPTFSCLISDDHLHSMIRAWEQQSQDVSPFPMVHFFQTTDDLSILAEQLCLVEHSIFVRITPVELFSEKRIKKLHMNPSALKSSSSDSTVYHLKNRMNSFAYFIILLFMISEDKLQFYERMLNLAEILISFQNFSSVLQIYLSLNSHLIYESVQEIKKQLTKKFAEIWTRLEQLISLSTSFIRLKEAMEQAAPPCIPALNILTRDLTLLDIHMNDRDEAGKLNITKFEEYSKITSHFRKVKCHRYPFLKIPLIFEFLDYGYLDFMGTHIDISNYKSLDLRLAEFAQRLASQQNENLTN